MMRWFGRTILLILLGSLLWSPRQSDAHGLGEQQLERVEAGPFFISAWTDPIEANTQDELHITVAVEDEDGLVLAADVTVSMIQGDQTYRDSATHEKAVNKLQYEGRFRLDEGGTWRVEIAVEDGDRVGSAGFDLPVEAINDSALPISIGWIIAGVVALVLAGLAVLNRRNLARQKKDVL